MFRRVFAPLAILMAVLPAGAATAPATVTYLSYDPYTGNNDLVQPVFYQLPNASVFGKGPYPVAIWIPGTFEVPYDPLSLLFVTQMAERGFLAASVEYSNEELLQQTCSAYTPRAKSLFEASVSTSAVSTICALSGASCSKGIVVSGISQGGILAVMAKNYAPEVQAVYALSTGSVNNAGIGVNLTSCMGKSTTTIPADRLTIVNGAADPAFGTQSSTQAASGITCPSGSTQCWSPDGSGAGWYLVQDSQVVGGNAGHCYIDNDDVCDDNFQKNWAPPASYNWSFASNLNWLATFGTKRVFSSSGQ
jgi:dienelactone hydrolase